MEIFNISFQERRTRWRQEVLQLNLFTLNRTEQPGNITAHLFNRTFQRCEHHSLNSTHLRCVCAGGRNLWDNIIVVIWSNHLFSLIGDHSKHFTLQITHSLTHSCTNYLPSRFKSEPLRLCRNRQLWVWHQEPVVSGHQQCGGSLVPAQKGQSDTQHVCHCWTR